MKTMYEVVENLCEREGMVCHKATMNPSQPDLVSLAIKFRSPHCCMWCEFRIRENERTALVVASSGIRVPQDRMPQVYEFIVRANFGLQMGRMDMDPATGDVQFVHSMCARGCGFSRATVAHLLSVAIGTYDNYHPGLCAVAYGQQSPLDAICQSEGVSQRTVNQVASKLLGEHSDGRRLEPEEDDNKLDQPPTESEDRLNE